MGPEAQQGGWAWSAQSSGQGGGCANTDSTPRKLQKLYTDHIPGYAVPFGRKTCLMALMSCPHLSYDGSLMWDRVQHRVPSERWGR